jgi:hypothetical protein
MEQWAAGQFNGDKPIENSLMNAGALAEYRLVDRLLELTYDQLEEALTDE